MAKIWYKLIKAGKATIDQVPEEWREEVQKMLDDDEKQPNSQPSEESDQ